jgi:glycerol kinase
MNILALDQGTSGSTALVIDADGRVVARGHAELPQHYPEPGWVEHDPEDIWTTVVEAARQALAGARIPAGEVLAIGVTNQRETTLVWERRTGTPIHRAIVWQDRRTAGMCERLRAQGIEDLARERTGLLLDAYFSGTKIAWLLDHVPDARRRAGRGELAFGTVDAWLLWKLTGGRVHVTDATNASRTLCLNLDTVDWDPDMLEALGVPREVLPAVGPSSGVLGETADLGWLRAGVPVAGVAGDQQAALFGQACYEPGAIKNTYGTGCFALVNTGRRPVRSRQGLLTTIAWRLGAETTYALEGSVFIAGAALQWLRDGLGLITTAADSEAIARSVPDTAGVYFVPAFVGLGAPWWDMYARGTIVGLTRGSTRAHLVRAALEAIAFQSRDVLETMAGEAGVVAKALRVDGLAAGNDFLCQFQADVSGVAVERPVVIDTTAVGAAYLAGLAVGLWPSLDAVRTRYRIERTFTPDMDETTRARCCQEWRRAVERARGWARP